MSINKLGWKTLHRCSYPQNKWCKPKKLSMKFTITCSQAQLKCISNLLRCKDAHFGYRNKFSPFQKLQSTDSKNPSNLAPILHALGYNWNPDPLRSPFLACDCPESPISVKKLIVTWRGSVFCGTNKLIQIKYKVISCLDMMERSWRGHAASKWRGRWISPIQWQLTDCIQHNKKLHLTSNSQYIF